MRIGVLTWGSEGDLRPFMALSRGLSEAGHEVTLSMHREDGVRAAVERISAVLPRA